MSTHPSASDEHVAIDLPAWPSSAAAAVMVTFDVDADASMRDVDGLPTTTNRSALSDGRYGAVRGLGRILDLLGDAGVPGTFFVPAITAQRYPDAIRRIVEEGHEIGHHGFSHREPATLSDQEQVEEIARGLDALRTITGADVVGYRSPAWQLSDTTLTALLDHGFVYDSSCMGDDRPYFEQLGDRQLLILPPHWSLDDWPYFGFRGGEGALSDPDVVMRTWRAELDNVIAERRTAVFTMHPEVIGRAYRMPVLADLIAAARAHDNVWFATAHQVAAHVLAGTTP